MDSNSATPTPGVPVLVDGAALVRNVVDQATASLVARVNAVPVTAEDLLLAVAEIQKLPLETCDREARTRCLARMFNERNLKVIAINSQLEAMAHVVRSGKISRWVLSFAVAKVVFRAAAKAPLLFAESDWYFEQVASVASVREYAIVDGHV